MINTLFLFIIGLYSIVEFYSLVLYRDKESIRITYNALCSVTPNNTTTRVLEYQKSLFELKNGIIE